MFSLSDILGIRKNYQWLNAYKEDSFNIGSDGRAVISFYTIGFWEASDTAP
jgi:hypothetical protein